MDRRERIKQGRKLEETKSEGALVTRQRALGAKLSDDLTAELRTQIRLSITNEQTGFHGPLGPSLRASQGTSFGKRAGTGLLRQPGRPSTLPPALLRCPHSSLALQRLLQWLFPFQLGCLRWSRAVSPLGRVGSATLSRASFMSKQRRKLPVTRLEGRGWGTASPLGVMFPKVLHETHQIFNLGGGHYPLFFTEKVADRATPTLG